MFVMHVIRHLYLKPSSSASGEINSKGFIGLERTSAQSFLAPGRTQGGAVILPLLLEKDGVGAPKCMWINARLFLASLGEDIALQEGPGTEESEIGGCCIWCLYRRAGLLHRPSSFHTCGITGTSWPMGIFTPWLWGEAWWCRACVQKEMIKHRHKSSSLQYESFNLCTSPEMAHKKCRAGSCIVDTSPLTEPRPLMHYNKAVGQSKECYED